MWMATGLENQDGDVTVRGSTPPPSSRLLSPGIDGIRVYLIMQPLDEYIKLPASQRKAHLDLSTDCVERGGSSTNFRGLLAFFLNTTIACDGRKINLCHACHNAGCSNPNHLYWGTPKENFDDAVADGKHRKSIHELTVEKYGEAGAAELYRQGAKASGKARRGKPLSESHKRALSAAGFRTAPQ